jgi:Protein of unknown function (DUF3306)
MPNRIRLLAVLLALGSAGPALAQAQSGVVHPAAFVNVGTLTADSDFTIFMRSDVPPGVRRGALHRLWTLIQLPVSCYELCFEAAASDPTRLASEDVPAITQ